MLDASIVPLAGEWDIGRRDELRALLTKHYDVRRLILDLTQTAYLDSTALTELVRLYKHRSSRGLDAARYANPNESVRRILHLANLAKIFPLYDSVDDARGSFESDFSGG